MRLKDVKPQTDAPLALIGLWADMTDLVNDILSENGAKFRFLGVQGGHPVVVGIKPDSEARRVQWSDLMDAKTLEDAVRTVDGVHGPAWRKPTDGEDQPEPKVGHEELLARRLLALSDELLIKAEKAERKAASLRSKAGSAEARAKKRLAELQKGSIIQV